MVHEWQSLPLSELYEFSSGLSKPRSEFGFGHGFLTFMDVMDNYFVPQELSALVNSTEAEQEKCSIKRGDVFLTRTSETQPDLGMSCVALKDYSKATFNGFTKRLRPKSTSTVVPEYAAYFFRSRRFRQAVTSMSSLSTRASLNNEMLSRLSITLPPVSVQEAIGYILKSLDDKVELNRRMNVILEGMARAIFKAWFVDFEPVKAKATGATSYPGMPQPVFDQLPASLIQSELGAIPDGWRWQSLDTLFEVNPHRPLRKGDNAPYLEMADMPTVGHAPSNWEYRHFGSGMRFINGDTLVARITPCLENGKTAFVDFLPDNTVGWGSTEYIVLRPHPPFPNVYVYCLARSPTFRDFAISNMTGTSGRQRVPASVLSHFMTIRPNERMLKSFGEIAEPLFHASAVNMRENCVLAQIRDSLLPKLIAGEIAVPLTNGGGDGK